MTSTINVHGGCVVLDDAAAVFGATADFGVLLLGESGSGKSDLALRLIARGAKLVSDDRTDLFVRNDELYACAPSSIGGLIEVRGVGIIELHTLPEARVNMVVVGFGLGERLPKRAFFAVPDGLKLGTELCPPLLHMDFRHVSTPDKILLAAGAFTKGLFREGPNA